MPLNLYLNCKDFCTLAFFRSIIIFVRKDFEFSTPSETPFLVLTMRNNTALIIYM